MFSDLTFGVLYIWLLACGIIRLVAHKSQKNMVSVTHSFLPVLDDDIPVLLTTEFSEFLSPFHHYKEDSRACHSDKRC